MAIITSNGKIIVILSDYDLLTKDVVGLKSPVCRVLPSYRQLPYNRASVFPARTIYKDDCSGG